MMQKLLVLAVVAFATTYAFDPECMSEFLGQKDCFFGVVKTAFGANDDIDMETMKSVTKGCFEAQSCDLPRSMGRSSFGAAPDSSDDEPTRVARSPGKGHKHGHKHGKMGADFDTMKTCVTEKKSGDPFEIVKECVMTETSLELPSFMNRAPKTDKAVFNSRKCPYFRMLKFIAQSGNMGEHVKKMCKGDETKKDAVISCVAAGTGVDLNTLNRDDIKASLCENKGTCYTEKLTECKHSIRDMIKSACRCKTENLNEAMTECATENSITLPEELTMECDALLAAKKQKYDMCDDDFEFPSESVYARGGKKDGARHKRHEHAVIDMDHPMLYFI